MPVYKQTMRTVENNSKFRHSTCGNLEQDATCFLIYKIEMAFSIHYSVIQSNLGVKSTGVHLRIKSNWKKNRNVQNKRNAKTTSRKYKHLFT